MPMWMIWMSRSRLPNVREREPALPNTLPNTIRSRESSLRFPPYFSPLTTYLEF
jgi:hypothetical protein